MGLLDFLTGGSPQDRFAKEVTTRIRAYGWTGPIDYELETFTLALGASGIQLGSGFLDQSRGGRARREQVIDGLARLALEAADPPPATLADIQDRLLPVIRKRLHVGDAWLVLPSWELGSHRLSHAPIGDSLCAWTAIDAGAGMKLVRDEELERWGVAFDQVLAIAVENLRERSTPARFEKDPRGFYTSNYRDYYDASRLLLPELLLELPLKGDPVAITPERDTLAVAGSEDGAALDAMAEQLESAMPRMARLISPEPVIWRDGAWRSFNHRDVTRPIGRLPVLGKVLDCRWQAMLMEEQLEANGRREVHCAELRPLEGDRPATWSPIAFGKTMLAPLADAYLLIGSDDGASLVRTPADFEAICGPFAREPDCWPERLLIDRPPTEEQWAQLRGAPVPAGFEALQAQFAGDSRGLARRRWK